MSKHRFDPYHGMVVSINRLQDEGGWEKIFGRAAPIELEIGFGWDCFLQNEAIRHPETNYVGIEYDAARVAAFVHRATEKCINNIRVIWGDVFHCLPRMFEKNQIKRTWILFPDPWPKKKHHKNRILGLKFLKILFHHMNPGGCLVIGTDSPEYAEVIIENLSAMKGVSNTLSDQWTDLNPAGYQTKFEQLFRSQGKSIFYFIWKKMEDFDKYYLKEIENVKNKIPGRIKNMPHVVFDKNLDIENLVSTFEPTQWFEARIIFKITDLWKSSRHQAILLEAIIVDEGHDELFYLEISKKKTKTVLKVSPLRDVERNELLFKFFSKVVLWIDEKTNNMRILRHNLGNFLERNENGKQSR